MRLAVRWNIGAGSEEGDQALRQSIACWRREFKEDCHYAVCYNSRNTPIVPDWVACYSQEKWITSLPLPPTGPAWKLYPARLFDNMHELVIDNDVVITSIPPLIEKWLSQGGLLCSQAYKRNYGQFDNRVPKNVLINSGILGFPPGFDFHQEIVRMIREVGLKSWESHFCEQGCVASIFSEQGYTQLSLDDISVGVPEEEFKIGRHGIHFVGLNATHSAWWRQYLCGKHL